MLTAKSCAQGDPLAMPMYALATIPLIDELSGTQDITQVWYADDASAAGSLSSIRTTSSSQDVFRYNPNVARGKNWASLFHRPCSGQVDAELKDTEDVELTDTETKKNPR